jgi:7-cyano-7-deazaguanine tRNA-ribosyltransferase
MKVFDVLKEEREWLSQFEPAYRYKTPVKTGKESDNRPIFAEFTSSGKGDMIHPYFGNISLHLSETYPFHPGLLQDDIEGWKMQGWDVERVRTILDYQFGKGMGEALTNGDVELVTSRKTKRLRNLMLDGKHLASLSHRRGLFILQEYGAEMIQRNTDFPRLRVVIDPETAAFNRGGKSVFCKFVKDIDQNLRCMDECIIVTPDDELVAFGKLVISPEELRLGQQGMAVRVRGGIPDQ